MIVEILAAGGAAQTEPMDKDSAYLALFGIIALFVMAYWISLRIHPYTKCGSCKGAGRFNGNLFSYSFGTCRRCGGSGRKSRLGRRLFVRDS